MNREPKLAHILISNCHYTNSYKVEILKTLSDDLSKDLQKANIINTKMITESDHGPLLINLDLKTF
ncbi:4965_t:CDS:2, partial [Gigaspora margarita]